VAQTTLVGVVMLGLSLAIAAGGAGAWRHAASFPAPIDPPAREIAGRVVDIVTQSCGPASRRGTCYRPVVAYQDGGRSRQTVARTASSPAPARTGDAAGVLVFADGAVWIASEWRTRQAERRREHASARRTPTALGWILIACAGVTGLLGLGLIFWIDPTP
jgi:hypothetical protein